MFTLFKIKDENILTHFQLWFKCYTCMKAFSHHKKSALATFMFFLIYYLGILYSATCIHKEGVIKLVHVQLYMYIHVQRLLAYSTLHCSYNSFTARLHNLNLCNFKSMLLQVSLSNPKQEGGAECLEGALPFQTMLQCFSNFQ